MLLAVRCKLLAVRSVRSLKSWLPLAISADATSMPDALARTELTASSMRPSVDLSAVPPWLTAATPATFREIPSVRFTLFTSSASSSPSLAA